MKKIQNIRLVAAVVFAAFVAVGTNRANAEGPEIRTGSLSTNLLNGYSPIEDGSKSLSRFNSPVGQPTLGRPFTIEDYQHKTSLTEVKESFSNFMGSLGSFLGNIFNLLTQKRMLVPGIFLLMGIRALFRK